MKRTFFTILCIFSLFLLSCSNRSTETVTLSSETEVTSFYFNKHDSFPSIGNTKFTISLYAAQDTGLITNADSMAYKTPIDKLVPRLLFKSTPSSATIITADTTINLTGKDTIDFTEPVLLRVISSDRTATKYYRIVVNVHHVDPDLFDWHCLTSAVVSSGTASTKGVVLNGTYLLFANDGFKTTVYQSADGKKWDDGTTLTTLPDNCSVREILACDDGDKLYYCQEGVVYTTTDGITWEAQDLSGETYIPLVMLMHFNDSVWLVAEHASEHTFHLAVEDGDTWRAIDDPLPAKWPLSEFTVVSFASSSERPRAMIVGGYDTEGNPLNSRWNIEYSQAAGYRYANFAIERPLCSAILGAAAVYYGNRFYLFGGLDAEAQYISSTALYSDDEGLNWFPIDTAHNRLMDVYTQRTQTSATVYGNCVYLFGGQSRTEMYSDVLCGKLTSIDW
jgi:hypothetical protein